MGQESTNIIHFYTYGESYIPTHSQIPSGHEAGKNNCRQLNSSP